MIYLDHAASTPVTTDAKKLLSTLWTSEFANPTAGHKMGQQGRELIEQARLDILSELGDSGGRLIFTSSATESNNTILQGIGLKAGDQVLYSPADHPSITAPLDHMASKLGIKLVVMPLDKIGRVDLVEFKKLLTPKLRLVALTWVNNSSGHIYPAMAMAKMVKESNPKTHFHLDAAQGFGKIALELSPTLIDSVAISAHKMGGPCGISALYLKEGGAVEPLLWGGGQEGGVRSSTPATVLISAFAAAVKEARRSRQREYPRVRELGEMVHHALKKQLGDRVLFPFVGDDISPYIHTMLFPKVAGDMLLRYLERDQIYLSSTSACSSRTSGKNTVLSHLGVDQSLHGSVLRCSFGVDSCPLEVEQFCQLLIQHHQKIYSLVVQK
jgi:cysteine desulfurase